MERVSLSSVGSGGDRKLPRSSTVSTAADNMIKVAVVKEGEQNLLTSLDQNRPLTAIVNDICNLWHYNDCEKFALQDKEKRMFITETNRHEIKMGDILELTDAPSRTAELTLSKLKGGNSAEKPRSLRELAVLSRDITYAQEFISQKGLEVIVDIVVEGKFEGEPLVHTLKSFIQLMEHVLHYSEGEPLVHTLKSFIQLMENVVHTLKSFIQLMENVVHTLKSFIQLMEHVLHYSEGEPLVHTLKSFIQLMENVLHYSEGEPLVHTLKSFIQLMEHVLHYSEGEPLVHTLKSFIQLMEHVLHYSEGEPLVHTLKSFIQLMEHGIVSWDVIESEFVKIVAGLVSFDNKNYASQVLCAMEILESVLLHSSGMYSTIEQLVTVQSIGQHLQSKDPDVKKNCIALMNAMLLKAEPARKNKLIDSIRTGQLRNTILTDVMRAENIGPAMAHELHVLQSHVLNQLHHQYVTPADPTNQETMVKVGDLLQMAFQMEMDPCATINSRRATGGTGNPYKDFRKLGFSNCTKPVEDFMVAPPGLLTLDNLSYFAKKQSEGYTKMVLENSVRGDEHDCPITRAAIALTTKLCQILRVGEEPSDEGQTYHPMFFCHDQPFEELFCICMQALNKTWKDMRATVLDFDKVLEVVQEQITRSLQHPNPPRSFDVFRNKLNSLSYQEIRKIWESDRQSREEYESQAQPILDLRKQLEPEITQLIKQQRINYLIAGAMFMKFTPAGKRRKDKWWYCRLSANQKAFHYGDCEENAADPPIESLSNKLSVSDVKDLVVGKDCPHMEKEREESRKSQLAFAILTDTAEPLCFVAADEKQYNIWTDGLNAIIGRPMLSSQKRADMDTLMAMEIKLRLLDIEGIRIPTEAPTIPKPPMSKKLVIDLTDISMDRPPPSATAKDAVTADVTAARGGEMAGGQVTPVQVALPTSKTDETKERHPSDKGKRPSPQGLLRAGIVWDIGERLEAMDYQDKWYCAKILEVDIADSTVMVHFDGWNSRFDQWFPMTSERLRPLSRQLDRIIKEKQRLKREFKVGDFVLAKWTDCRVYPARVTTLINDGSYEVMFYDGIKKIVQPMNLRVLPDSLSYKKAMFPPMPKGMPGSPALDPCSATSSPASSASRDVRITAVIKSFNKEKHMLKQLDKGLKLSERPSPMSPTHSRSSHNSGSSVKSSLSEKLAKVQKSGKTKFKSAFAQSTSKESRKSGEKPPRKKQKMVVAGLFAKRKIVSQSEGVGDVRLERRRSSEKVDKSIERELDSKISKRIISPPRHLIDSVTPKPLHSYITKGQSSHTITKPLHSDHKSPTDSSKPRKRSHSGSTRPSKSPQSDIPKHPKPSPHDHDRSNKPHKTIEKSGSNDKLATKPQKIEADASDNKWCYKIERDENSLAHKIATTTKPQEIDNSTKQVAVAISRSGEKSAKSHKHRRHTHDSGGKEKSRTGSDKKERSISMDSGGKQRKFSGSNKEKGSELSISLPHPSQQSSLTPTSSKSQSAVPTAESGETKSAGKFGIYEYFGLPIQPKKKFVIEEDHNHFKCTRRDCNKAFRKQSLLESHIKFYHSGEIRGMEEPVKKRRKRRRQSSTSTEGSMEFERPKLHPKAPKRDLPTMVPPPRHSTTTMVPPPRHSPTKAPMSLGVPDDSVKTEVDPYDIPILPQDTDTKPVLLPTSPTTPIIPTTTAVATTTDDITQDHAMVTEDGVETEEEEMARDEIVHCVCGVNEENGLMAQCEVCLCWQHASCFNLTAATLPNKYICYVCLDPPGVRDSARYLYRQEWYHEGRLPPLCPSLNGPIRDTCKNVVTMQSLMAELHNILTVQHSIKLKLHALQCEDHPEIQLWHKKWNKKGEHDDLSDITMDASLTSDLFNIGGPLSATNVSLNMSGVSNFSNMTLDSAVCGNIELSKSAADEIIRNEISLKIESDNKPVDESVSNLTDGIKMDENIDFKAVRRKVLQTSELEDNAIISELNVKDNNSANLTNLDNEDSAISTKPLETIEDTNSKSSDLSRIAQGDDRVVELDQISARVTETTNSDCTRGTETNALAIETPRTAEIDVSQSSDITKQPSTVNMELQSDADSNIEKVSEQMESTDSYTVPQALKADVSQSNNSESDDIGNEMGPAGDASNSNSIEKSEAMTSHTASSDPSSSNLTTPFADTVDENTDEYLAMMLLELNSSGRDFSLSSASGMSSGMASEYESSTTAGKIDATRETVTASLGVGNTTCGSSVDNVCGDLVLENTEKSTIPQIDSGAPMEMSTTVHAKGNNMDSICRQDQNNVSVHENAQAMSHTSKTSASFSVNQTDVDESQNISSLVKKTVSDMVDIMATTDSQKTNIPEIQTTEIPPNDEPINKTTNQLTTQVTNETKSDVNQPPDIPPHLLASPPLDVTRSGSPRVGIQPESSESFCIQSMSHVAEKRSELSRIKRESPMKRSQLIEPYTSHDEDEVSGTLSLDRLQHMVENIVDDSIFSDIKEPVPQPVSIETCRENLTEHIMALQDELMERLDVIEHHINVLESKELRDTGYTEEGMTQLKKSMVRVLEDLPKLELLTMYSH